MRFRKFAIMLCVLAFVALCLVPVAAQEEAAPAIQVPPKDRLYLASLTIARYNPLGLETQNRLMYSRRLADSTSPLFRDTFFALGLSTKLNPAYLKVGPLIDFQPIGIFNLRLGYEYLKYFGTMGYLQSYPNSKANFSDDARKDTEDDAYSTGGHHLFAEPMVQMKVGRIAARSKFAFEYWKLDLEDDDKYFYDATLDTLVPYEKMIWGNDTDLIYMNGRLTLGVRYSAVLPGNGLEHMRVGPLFAWSFSTDDYGSFNKPSLLMILGWYFKHPDRVGAVPYFLVGFSFSSDFLAPKTN
ncbi:MAG TPA: hypothetical protein PKO25_08235 [Spirochaetota bacterium]|nr:hypothetical protein [Spirochaetota bacterium]OPZ37492.1 MAG: hypothetical protein BWY96_01674 [Spirochaetes bacterium ADurb.BinA120]HNU91845.1 hypothetical protein [Spirochaetota bacterium]HPI13528.1 hypothetical protein [Spirochaetota bacterium]HPO44254.1 hypothetical protein [Spirochaetota bacterium]